MTYFIDPITTVDAHILAGTSLSEDPTPAWVSGTYAVGDERHVVATHRVYRRTTAGSSTVSPELDATNWKDMRPTNKWAPFDIYSGTKATATTDITYKLQSRFVNAIMLRGLVGKSVRVTVRDTAGGTVLFDKTYTLKRSARGYYDYAFGLRKYLTSLVVRELPIRSAAEITITVSAAGTNPRAIGMIVRGKLQSLHGTGSAVGGTLTDAEAQPKSYTFRKVNDDGTITYTPRGGSKDLSLPIIVDREQVDVTVQQLEELIGRPVAWIGSLHKSFSGLTAFGTATRSPVIYKGSHGRCNLEIEGIME